MTLNPERTAVCITAAVWARIADKIGSTNRYRNPYLHWQYLQQIHVWTNELKV